VTTDAISTLVLVLGPAAVLAVIGAGVYWVKHRGK
jgi:hypothetical protein